MRVFLCGENKTIWYHEVLMHVFGFWSFWWDYTPVLLIFDSFLLLPCASKQMGLF